MRYDVTLQFAFPLEITIISALILRRCQRAYHDQHQLVNESGVGMIITCHDWCLLHTTDRSSEPITHKQVDYIQGYQEHSSAKQLQQARFCL